VDDGPVVHEPIGQQIDQGRVPGGVVAARAVGPVDLRRLSGDAAKCGADRVEHVLPLAHAGASLRSPPS
jgi:hypothetical protein